ncbi:hypothetical protein D3C71_1687090 [compost metagenome]
MAPVPFRRRERFVAWQDVFAVSIVRRGDEVDGEVAELIGRQVGYDRGSAIELALDPEMPTPHP